MSKWYEVIVNVHKTFAVEIGDDEKNPNQVLREAVSEEISSGFDIVDITGPLDDLRTYRKDDQYSTVEEWKQMTDGVITHCTTEYAPNAVIRCAHT